MRCPCRWYTIPVSEHVDMAGKLLADAATFTSTGVRLRIRYGIDLHDLI